MCGLAGFAEVACTEDAARALLKSLADCLAHRGPDGSGTLWHAADRVGLAHRRLAILDAGTTGDQPMVSATGRTAIAFNGEIVNAPELARSLRNQGVALRGHSDTEVLLEAIEAWGIDRALELCAGMFAFALHDRSRRCVHLVRDRMGVKPLHWMRVGRGVAFASEVRALRRMPGAPDTLDPAAVASLLSHGCVTGTRCVWSGVEKLAPGHRLEFDAGSGEVRMLRWWDPLEVATRGCARPFRGSDRDAVEAGRSLAARVVREHLLSDVPVACFLSGGIDSRFVAALALGEGVARPPRCFTAGFDDAAFDERDEAGRAARALGLAWESFEITERAMVAAVPDLATVFDEPFADSSQVPTLLLARRVREHAPWRSRATAATSSSAGIADTCTRTHDGTRRSRDPSRAGRDWHARFPRNWSLADRALQRDWCRRCVNFANPTRPLGSGSCCTERTIRMTPTRASSPTVTRPVRGGARTRRARCRTRSEGSSSWTRRAIWWMILW
jgi:asparagine synthase (glutamine-hydrolysing)